MHDDSDGEGVTHEKVHQHARSDEGRILQGSSPQ